jgi:hypothetical protein
MSSDAAAEGGTTHLERTAWRLDPARSSAEFHSTPS